MPRLTIRCEALNGLVPAGEVVVLGDAVEAERLVSDGLCELRGVDDAGLERLEDLAGRQHGDRGTDALHHAAAEAGEADLEAVQVVARGQWFAEPARGLGGRRCRITPAWCCARRRSPRRVADPSSPRRRRTTSRCRPTGRGRTASHRTTATTESCPGRSRARCSRPAPCGRARRHRWQRPGRVRRDRTGRSGCRPPVASSIASAIHTGRLAAAR